MDDEKWRQDEMMTLNLFVKKKIFCLKMSFLRVPYLLFQQSLTLYKQLGGGGRGKRILTFQIKKKRMELANKVSILLKKN